MKKLFFTLTLLLFFLIGNSQTTCEHYFPYPEGEDIVTITFDKKDKISGYQIMNVTDKSSDGASLFFKIYDEKGKESGTLDYDITCEGDRLLIDMDAYLSQDQMASLENVEMEMEGEPLELPRSLSVGQELKPGDLTVKTTMNGMPFMTITVEIYDRKVVGKETISTSIGDFECYKIVQKMKSNMGIVKFQGSSEEYWSEGAGLIKSVSMNKNGKILGHQIRGSKDDIK